MSENNNEYKRKLIEEVYLSFSDGLSHVISKSEDDEVDMIFSIIPSVFKQVYGIV